MRLHYLTKDGKTTSIELTEKPLTIGRSADADVLILDEKASRVHCGIRFWDGEYFIKDLKSKNGTFVNDMRVDNIHQLNPGDRVRVGATLFIFEQEANTGTDTALIAMQDAFKGGKGYSTILREIVDETDHEQPVTSVEAPAEDATIPEAAKPEPAMVEVSNNDVEEEPATPAEEAPADAPAPQKKKVTRPPLKRKPLKIRISKKSESDED